MYLESKANQLNLDETTKNLAQELLETYIKKKSIPQDEKFIVPCALYLACQSITIKNLSGEDINGNGINLTQIIRWLDESIDMESFFKVLDEFLSVVNEDIAEEIQAELQQTIRQASMSFRIYKKFDQCITAMGIKKSFMETEFNVQFQSLNKESMSSTPIFKDENEPFPAENVLIEEEAEKNSYLANFKNLSWIIFLLLKQALPEYEKKAALMVTGNSDMKNTLLLIAHLASLVISLPDGYICSMVSDSAVTPEQRQRELPSIIKQVSLVVAPSYDGFGKQQFIDEIDEYMKICGSFIQELKSLILKNSSSHKTGGGGLIAYSGLLEEGALINNFYRKFSQYYECQIKEMKDENMRSVHLDEECFLRQKVVYTPKKRSSQFETKGSHPLANIDSCDLLYDKVSKKVKLSDEPSSKYIQKPSGNDFQQHSLFQQTPLRSNKFTQSTPKQTVQATPVSKVMLQYQWLKNLTQEINVRYKFDYCQNDNSILDTYAEIVGRDYYMSMLESVERKAGEYARQDIVINSRTSMGTQNLPGIVQVLMRFFLRVLEQMVLNENDKEPDQIPNLLKNPEFINALLAITIQTHQHISSKEVQMSNLLTCCQISTVELWRIISNFATFQKNIPDSITKHLFDLEKAILLHHIWDDQHNYIIQLLIQKVQNQSQRQRYFEVVLLRRLSHHIALRVLELQQVLQIEDSCKELAWNIIQIVLDNPPKIDELWKQRHFDQVIICTFYMILKHAKANPEFKKFREVVGINTYSLSYIFRNFLPTAPFSRPSSSTIILSTCRTSSSICPIRRIKSGQIRYSPRQ